MTAGLVGFLLGLTTVAYGEAATLDRLSSRLENGQAITLATCGDSITWPCFHTDFRQNYITLTVDALKKAYPKAQIRIVHAGNMGSAGRVLDANRFDKYVLAHEPDAVFIMFGMNDCLGGPAQLDAYDRNLTSLIHKTRQAGGLPIICTQNEILYDYADTSIRKDLPLYMKRAIEVAAREKVPAVDCFARWKPLLADRDALIARLNDGIHPNLPGHRMFAKTILETLWPKAVPFASNGLRTPPDPGSPPPVDCLLPGPADKQIIQTEDGTWFTLTGRRSSQQITELVFSWARKDAPLWDDFRHITLVGGEPRAVFDYQGRIVTAGMLLEHRNRVFVAFSWNTGVYFASLNLTRADWPQRAEQPKAWIEHTNEPFVRPTHMVCHNRNAGLLYDGFISSDGYPAVICAHFQYAAGAGWEVIEGQDGVALVTRAPGQEPAVQFLSMGSLPPAPRMPAAYQLQCAGGRAGRGILSQEDDRLVFKVIPTRK